MSLPRFAVGHRTVVLVAVAILVAVGTLNFTSMPRREDPEIMIRDCIVITVWPGAAVPKVEELVTDPLEKAFGEIKSVDRITSKSRVGLSIITIRLEDDVRDAAQYWDEVRAKVDQTVSQLPEGCRPPQVKSDIGDVFQLCFALHQTPAPGRDAIERPYSPRELELIANTVEDRLEQLPSVSKVDLWGVRPERIYVEVDAADWAKLDVTARELRDLFQARNIVAPGGEVDTETGRYAVTPTGEFGSLEQIEGMVLDRLDGRLPIRLRDLPLRIERRYEEPARVLTRVTTAETSSAPCLVVGVAMKAGRNIAVLDAEVRGALAELNATLLPPDIELIRVNDLPRQVDVRINDFVENLIQGVIIVLGVALLMMGWRPALIMATAVPLSMLAAFAVVRSFGVALEQFSIASLIIALGMVVDNAIVVSDNTVRLVREGRTMRDAVVEGAQGLAIPILTSTLTTVCAFLPMLTLPGGSGEYTRSLPIVVASTLGASYFVAMLVTPLMCLAVLKPSKPKMAKTPKKPKKPKPPRKPAYDRVLGWCLGHKLITLAAAVLLFVGALSLAPLIGSQFFPAGSRDQFFIHVWMPESAPISATDRVCREVEAILREESEGGEDHGHRLASAATFVGNGGPRIMLTQATEETFPYYGFILVNTTDAASTAAYAKAVRDRVAAIPGARILVNEYMFGPPVKNPIEFRLSGPDDTVLRVAAERMNQVVGETPGAIGANSDWGSSGYQVRVDIDVDAANVAGVTNADVALTMSALLSGQTLTTFREGDHLVPVVFRTERRNRGNLDDLSGIFVSGRSGKVPIPSIASVEPTWQPSVIARRDGIRTVTIGSRVAPGLLPNAVAQSVLPRLKEIVAELPPGYELVVGGEQEETGKAQANMAFAFSIALGLIVLILVAQYDSLLKPLVILFTVPLAVIGVMLGLWITGWAISFMVMLGIVSLAGIVINNAIILIDFVEGLVAEGHGLREAMAMAGRLRLKPILLTSLTTIGGLLPLALFGGPLWAGMAWGMVFGLVFSTALTLLVVPTLYTFFAEVFGMRVVRTP